MLNGVGGRTIYEAKQNLSAREVQLWYALHQRRGSFNIARRFQQELAFVKQLLHVQVGAKRTDIWDYQPNEEAPPLTFEEAQALYQRGG